MTKTKQGISLVDFSFTHTKQTQNEPKNHESDLHHDVRVLKSEATKCGFVQFDKMTRHTSSYMYMYCLIHEHVCTRETFAHRRHKRGKWCAHSKHNVKSHRPY